MACGESNKPEEKPLLCFGRRQVWRADLLTACRLSAMVGGWTGGPIFKNNTYIPARIHSVRAIIRMPCRRSFRDLPEQNLPTRINIFSAEINEHKAHPRSCGGRGARKKACGLV